MRAQSLFLAGLLLTVIASSSAAYAGLPAGPLMLDQDGGEVPPPARYVRGEEIVDRSRVIQGDIDSLDGTSNGLLYEDYLFTLREGRRYRLSAVSISVDPMLQIFTEQGTQVLAENDDGGRGSSARLIFVPTETAVHRIRVVNAFPRLRGVYTLTVEPADPLPDPLPLQGSRAPATEWTSIEGRLSPEDPALEGRRLRDYVVELGAQEEIFVRLDSGDFDPVIEMLPASNRETGLIVADDDSGPGPNSLLLFAADQAGSYIVRVTTFAPEETGQYVLRIGR